MMLAGAVFWRLISVLRKGGKTYEVEELSLLTLKSYCIPHLPFLVELLEDD